jgi:hypothetical protein
VTRRNPEFVNQSKNQLINRKIKQDDTTNSSSQRLVLDAYGDEAVVVQHVEETGDYSPVPSHACLDGVVDDGLHAGVAALPGVEVVCQLAPAACGRRQQDDDGGE